MLRPGSALGRLFAALLLVTLPAMTAAMPLAAPVQSPAGHAGHHEGSRPHQHPGHQQCCDLCGAACGGCAGLIPLAHSTPGPLAREIRQDPPVTEGAEPYAHPRLLPFPLGPPLLHG